MYILRLTLGAGLAVVVTLLLLFFMQSLIQQEDLDLDQRESRKIADIQMGDTEIETRVEERKPEKPDEPEEMPPEMDLPELQDMEVSASGINITPSFDVDMSFGEGARLSASDGEYLPIVRVPPEYPRRALSRGIEGYCVVEFTVTRAGTVRDPVAIDCDSIFEQASIQAVLRFKYQPRIEDGEPVEVHGVRNMFTYKLSD